MSQTKLKAFYCGVDVSNSYSFITLLIYCLLKLLYME